MASVFVKKMMVAVVSPLRHWSRQATTALRMPPPLRLGPLPPVWMGLGGWAGRPLFSRTPLPCPQPAALGFKTKGVLKKRCKDCYFVKRRGRWFVLCKTHPRHKQRQL
ncbi:39S ribosomal protein L36, mitochondrial [Tachyglossus aculeatus]|uniref:39S ribosomal protein L36, mitochondrial n=1 Tax=Tachyglossus aculeatus TaxID=9261 RepID=UPI0018F63E9E|nr:39S ribosomal protein L36, mitochondrial [Tachyglossus aculeatus]